MRSPTSHDSRRSDNEVDFVVEDVYGILIPKGDLHELMKDKKRIDNVEPNFFVNPAMCETYFKQVQGTRRP